MLRLRSSILTHLLSSPAAPAISPLHRFLSAAAPAVSPNPSFAVQEYLVETCGLTRPQALKASAKLSHLTSPSKPNTVLAFLSGLGLSNADVAAAVAKDPQLLCVKVDGTLAPIVIDLTELGLSHTETARLFSLVPQCFRCRSMVSNLPYYRSLFGSWENVLRILRCNTSLLSADLEAVVKPNIALLRECGLGACDIAKVCLSVRWILGTKPEHVQAMVARAEAIGVRRGSGMFRQALHAVALLSKEKIATQLECLKNTLRWSDADVGIAVCKFPMMLTISKNRLQRKSEFLISEVVLEPSYIATRPAMLSYSLEGRLRPRYYVLMFLKANGLVDHDRDYYSAVALVEKIFVEKYICPHKEAAPYLAEDYEAACRGEVQTRFRFA